MKRLLLGCTVLLALAACASHLPRCGGRLTPINHASFRPGPKSAARPPTHATKAARS